MTNPATNSDTALANAHSGSSLARYARQMRFAPLGETGQQRLANSRVLVCGCGALGSVIASTLARAGVGFLRLVDRDFVELNNLQRQVLYDEADVNSGLPKAIAAAEKLRQVNSQIEIEPVVADLNAENVLGLAEGCDLILDGTDNFETRFLLNDVALKLGIPWVYGGCIQAEGQTLTVLPGETPCLRCVMPEPPLASATLTCDTAGVLGPIVNIVASLQAAEALKILSGNLQAVNRHWLILDCWGNTQRQIDLAKLTDRSACPACTGTEYAWLSGARGSQTAILCGRNAVQITPPSYRVDLNDLEQRLQAVGEVSRNRFLLRFSVPEYQLTVFPDGRTIVQGTEDIATARTLVARYLGS